MFVYIQILEQCEYMKTIFNDLFYQLYEAQGFAAPAWTLKPLPVSRALGPGPSLSWAPTSGLAAACSQHSAPAPCPRVLAAPALRLVSSLSVRLLTGLIGPVAPLVCRICLS